MKDTTDFLQTGLDTLNDIIPKKLHQQLQFILEMDKLKHVMRRSPLLDQSRTENDAEHSWHVATLALVLAEYAAPDVDIGRVISMLLLHDVVEIDAGDTFLYEESAFADAKEEREQRAAERIYGILPMDTHQRLKALWLEYEKCTSKEAKFAMALDRLQPILHNYFTGGGTWRSHDVTVQQVLSRQHVIEEGSAELGRFTRQLIDDALKKGYLKEA